MAARDDAVRPIRGQATEDVDLDLDANDALLREAVGKPTTVRIDGVVIHVDHAAEWSNEAMKAASQGDWDAWAREVIHDDDEYQAFQDANLVNYQYEAIFSECGKQASLTMGKSQRSARSSRSTRKR
jgi:hypothetical protein